ncbi:MAG: entericidin A/B family lipoprotein [Dissulfurimicrobium sp.]
MLSKKVILVVLLMSFCMMAGCNTFYGLGKDIQKGGEAIQRHAR